MEIDWIPHQTSVLNNTAHFNRCGYFLDMGLGKTFVGAEKLNQLNADYNLLVCQKSKVDDWAEHFQTYYPQITTILYKKQLVKDLPKKSILIITYDTLWRRPELKKLNDLDFTLMLDESQYIKNHRSNRGKFVLYYLHPANVILLSGTPVGGKYEELWSQCRLLGWGISEANYWDKYIITRNIDIGQPWQLEVVAGYKNVDDLKENLKRHGAVFMKTEEVLTLPEQIESIIKVPITPEYKKFQKDSIIKMADRTIVGDTSLTKLLYSRQLASQYNKNKIAALTELLESTYDRFIIFYSFVEEFNIIKKLCKTLNRPVSYINGSGRDLKAYDNESDSVTLVQYQSGSSGVNLQKSNKVIYFSLTQSCEQWLQSRKRVHRIGQNNTCFYYYLITENTVDVKIKRSLEKGEDYNEKLFEKGV